MSSYDRTIRQLRGAIEKKKKEIEKNKRRTKEIKKVVDAAAAALESAKEKKEREITELKKELKKYNLENAAVIDRTELRKPLLYNTAAEIAEIIKDDDKRVALVEALQNEFYTTTFDDCEVHGQLTYVWYEEPESGNPFDAEYGVLFDGYQPDETDSEAESPFNLCYFIKVNGRGNLVDEDTVNDWVRFSEFNQQNFRCTTLYAS